MYEEQDFKKERFRKRVKTNNEEVNMMVWEWLQGARSLNISTSDPVLLEACISFTQKINKKLILMDQMNGLIHFEKDIKLLQSFKCFNGLSKEDLSVKWAAIESIWMTLSIFRQWLEEQNEKMRLQKRNLLLLFGQLYNTSRSYSFKNLIKFFTFKHHFDSSTALIREQYDHLNYRKILVQYFINKISQKVKNIDDIILSNILDAVCWISEDTEKLSENCITIVLVMQIMEIQSQELDEEIEQPHGKKRSKQKSSKNKSINFWNGVLGNLTVSILCITKQQTRNFVQNCKKHAGSNTIYVDQQ
ncbi:hypothetical protein ABPG72_014417 [Tetrahymena utriculariae]